MIRKADTRRKVSCCLFKRELSGLNWGAILAAIRETGIVIVHQTGFFAHS